MYPTLLPYNVRGVDLGVYPYVFHFEEELDGGDL